MVAERYVLFALTLIQCKLATAVNTFSEISGSMEEKWSIEKLIGDNWLTWKFQMFHLLQAKEMWDYVDGSAVLSNNATDQQKQEFRKKLLEGFFVRR